jgi:hypothetical protein
MYLQRGTTAEKLQPAQGGDQPDFTDASELFVDSVSGNRAQKSINDGTRSPGIVSSGRFDGSIIFGISYRKTT